MVAIKTILITGEEAVRYTKSKVRWSTKHASDILFSGFSSPFKISAARDYEDELLEKIIKNYGKASSNCLVSIAIRAKAAEEHGVGNCGENAAVAFMWLYLNRPSMRPLDYCDRPSGDHGFVVIGSPVIPRLGNHEKWWEQGVVCDPFWNFTFTGKVALQHRYATTNVRSLCRVETALASGDGIARSVMKLKTL
jgi:hypothetical protein